MQSRHNIVSKPRDIVKRIAAEAKRQGLNFVLDREGANHTIYSLDGIIIPIPRHRESTSAPPRGSTASARRSWGKVGGDDE